jgi:L-ascorbate peroxidase
MSSAASPVAVAEYIAEIEKARRDLRALIASKSCAPIMLRLAYVPLVFLHYVGVFYLP